VSTNSESWFKVILFEKRTNLKPIWSVPTLIGC